MYQKKKKQRRRPPFAREGGQPEPGAEVQRHEAPRERLEVEPVPRLGPVAPGVAVAFVELHELQRKLRDFGGLNVFFFFLNRGLFWKTTYSPKSNFALLGVPFESISAEFSLNYENQIYKILVR